MSRNFPLARLTTVLCALAVATAAVALIAMPVASADRGKRGGPPTLLWKSYPLAPQAKRTANAQPQPQPKAATPPEPRPKTFAPPKRRPEAATPPEPRPKVTAQTKPRRQAVSYEISTDQTGTPRRLLLAVFLGGLLAVAGTMLVGRMLLPIRNRRRRRSTEAAASGPGDELVEALRPKPQPEALPKPVVPEGTPTVPKTRRPIVEKTNASNELKPGREPARLQTHRVESTMARCEIKLWRGFIQSHLYAAPAGSDEEPIAFSPYFHLLEGERSTSQALQALAALVEELEQDGWTVVSDGPAWYQHRLERSEGS
jgi:outer membrane biosynthesis protein TonB